MNRLFVAAVALALSSAVMLAAGPEQPKPRQLTLTPAKVSPSALKYCLLPEPIEQRPGNAVEHYKKARALVREKLPRDLRDKPNEWEDLPLDKLPRKEVRAWLKHVEGAIREAEAGALCQSCDWGRLQPHRGDGSRTAVPFVADIYTEVPSLLLLRLRLEMSEGRPDLALRTARTALAIARHLAECPAILPSYFGIGLASHVCDALEEYVTLPGAPNLYWALRDLPRPFVDLRKSFQGDRALFYACFPEMAEATLDPEAAPMSRERIERVVKNLLDFGPQGGDKLDRRGLAKIIELKHETAVKALLARGYARDKVKAMPYVQVAMLHVLGEYDQYIDGVLRCQARPYWEVEAELKEIDRRAKKNSKATRVLEEDAPALSILLLGELSGRSGVVSRTHLDRRLAALSCVEAIRHHAAEHGKLPTTLADIKAVPVPVDPVTGKQFAYEVKGVKAILTAPAFPADDPDPYRAIFYELTLRK
jgi:hypothetical protein